MSQIKLLDSLLTKYKMWTLKLNSTSIKVENNILQNDNSKKIEEKIISVGISSLIVYLGSAIIGLFGVTIIGIWSIVLFILGWLLSKVINKKVFGSQREIENLRDDEIFLIDRLNKINLTHKNIRDKINDKTIYVNFTNYIKLKKEFEELLNLLVNYDVSALALKYRYKHSYITHKYKIQINKFNEIYAHK